MGLSDLLCWWRPRGSLPPSARQSPRHNRPGYEGSLPHPSRRLRSPDTSPQRRRRRPRRTSRDRRNDSAPHSRKSLRGKPLDRESNRDHMVSTSATNLSPPKSSSIHTPELLQRGSLTPNPQSLPGASSVHRPEEHDDSSRPRSPSCLNDFTVDRFLEENSSISRLEGHYEPSFNLAEMKNSIPSPPPTKFVSYLFERSSSSTRDLMAPYLSYETLLRQAFSKSRENNISVKEFVNVVPIYEDPRIRITTIDRRIEADRDKYIMEIPPGTIGEHGAMAITPSLDEYRERFNGFTFGTLAGLADLPNVVIAGSAALLPLLPYRTDIEKIPESLTTGRPWETYYQETAKANDIDIFLYGVDTEEAIEIIRKIDVQIREKQGLHPGTGLALRSKHAITFIAPRWPFRHIQIILRLYQSISEILSGFDVDCSCVAFDGHQVYSSPRGVAAIATRTNIIDLTRRSPSYETRLWKYRQHNFDVFWKDLDRSLVNTALIQQQDSIRECFGLSRLLFSEIILEKQRKRKWYYRGSYWKTRTLMKIADSHDANPSSPSEYAAFDIPYGQSFNAERIRQYVLTRSGDAFFGTLDEVINGVDRAQASGHNERNIKLMTEKVSFIEDNPGRQMIGSFNPLSTDDWTDQAYESS